MVWKSQQRVESGAPGKLLTQAEEKDVT
jgi:hypothetical protein